MKPSAQPRPIGQQAPRRSSDAVVDPELILVDEGHAAKIFNVSVSTLQKDRVRGGGCPFVRLGRSVRYRIVDIRQHIASRVIRSTSENTAARDPWPQK